LEFLADSCDRLAVQHLGCTWEDGLFLDLNVFLVKVLELFCGGSQSLFVLRIEMASRNPHRVERIRRSVQIVGVAMVVFETANLLDVASDGFCAEPGKQRFFLIRGVSQPAHAKVLERRLYGCHLFVRQSSVPGAIRHHTENMKKTLDPAMAVDEHTNRVVKSAIWLRTYL
jgi:hypothetical protein